MRLRGLLLAAAAAAILAFAVTGVVSAGPKGSKGSKALFAVLTGEKEVSAEGERRVGDPDGFGSFSGTFDGSELCYGITVKKIEAPIAAHIHKGSPREAAPPVVPLQHPTTGDPGASSACTEVDPALARAIKKNPRKYYVNVHTADFPGGAVRGQLFGKRR